jgi:hypothetical protein
MTRMSCGSGLLTFRRVRLYCASIRSVEITLRLRGNLREWPGSGAFRIRTASKLEIRP